MLFDSREAMLSGGELGSAIVPGHPENSRLIAAVHQSDDLSMPPKSKLTEEQINVLTTWVKMGARWPDSGNAPRQAAAGPEYKITEKDRAFWAFQAVKEPPVPDAHMQSRLPPPPPP